MEVPSTATMFRKGKPFVGSEPTAPLALAVREHLPKASDETQRIVTAIAGLLGCVAFADHEYSEIEKRKVREELSRIHDLEKSAVDAICHVLAERLHEITTVQSHLWTRELRQLASIELRVEVLDVLVDLAAADDHVSLSETDAMRRIAAALGLSREDYNAAQARHRDKLAVLKS